MCFFLPLFLVVVLDQASKYWILQCFSLYETREIIPGLFNLTFLTNNGAAFSILAGQPALWRQLFFISATLVALVIIGIAQRSYSRDSRWYSIGLGLIAGGAIGNLIDRIRFAYVVDFLDLHLKGHHWPAFNIADAAISGGVVIFMITSILVERRKKQQHSTPI
ncbi:signal peptidase II [Desulfogranum mediterraneum]|uniref:signal peptidase II n=1 Tax=Desulfogranum mediterraneum TaxID=160661 RepID=UPI0004147AE5|nr:signal peptidase II [Desulfogranum mediterraneum]